MIDSPPTYTVFERHKRLFRGSAPAAAQAAAAAQARGAAGILVFEDATGRQVDLDPRLPAPAFAEPAPSAPAARTRGRPKLGVVAREVTLLPRHWEWLATQPGGASAALRRLVEDARKANAALDTARAAQQILYGVTSVLAGDLPRFEEASRALFARDDAKFADIVATWPPDVADYISDLARLERQARSPAPP